MPAHTADAYQPHVVLRHDLHLGPLRRHVLGRVRLRGGRHRREQPHDRVRPRLGHIRRLVNHESGARLLSKPIL